MELADLLDAEPVTMTIIGVEREYRVLADTGLPVDFRREIHRFARPSYLDPSDPNAHHLPNGIVLTADGPEAEVATPPIALAADSVEITTAWARAGEDALVSTLPAGWAIEGYSTHLNVSWGGDVVRLAKNVARRFGPALMAMLDLTDSPGLLVRPRAGRLEVGGDYVDGEQLRAAIVFTLAAARACAADPNAASAYSQRMQRAKERQGWFLRYRDLDRTALARAWREARPHVEPVVTAGDLAVVDAIVDGDRPLPSEAPAQPEEVAGALRSPFAELHPRTRNDLTIELAARTWAAVAFHVTSPTRDVHAVVPRRWLPSFLDALDRGALDDVLRTGRAHRRPGRGPTITRRFEPRDVVPPEPRVGRWWTRPEVLGAIGGIGSVLAVHQFWH